MGFVNRLFGQKDHPAPKAETMNNLAFVLLSEAPVPNASEIVRAFRDFGEPGETPQPEIAGTDKSETDQVISLRLSTGETAFVALVPAAVPNREADENAQFSVLSWRGNWTLPPHRAHYVVALQSPPTSTPIVQVSRFTSLVAAVIKSSPAVGVYWGNAGATHDSDFFVSVAA